MTNSDFGTHVHAITYHPTDIYMDTYTRKTNRNIKIKGLLRAPSPRIQIPSRFLARFSIFSSATELYTATSSSWNFGSRITQIKNFLCVFSPVASSRDSGELCREREREARVIYREAGNEIRRGRARYCETGLGQGEGLMDRTGFDEAGEACCEI